MFKILQLTDLHFGSQEHEVNDFKTRRLIEQLITSEHPDFIAVTGDVIWSRIADLTVFRAVMDLIDSFNIPFAVTFGNHDSEHDFSRCELSAELKRLTNHVEMTGNHDIAGRLSYYYDVPDQNWRLYFVDSGDYDKLAIGEYDYISHEQIDWLVKTDHASDRLSVLFTHIPLPEYGAAKAAGLAQGNQEEEVCAPVLNTGLYSRLLLSTNVKAIFCGHDHDNDYTADYHGIQLCYGRVSGYNTYGRLKRGGRIIELLEDMHTYIIEEQVE